MTIPAKAVRTEKHWHALCDLCGWLSPAFLTYQTANREREAHLTWHRMGEPEQAATPAEPVGAHP